MTRNTSTDPFLMSPLTPQQQFERKRELALQIDPTLDTDFETIQTTPLKDIAYAYEKRTGIKMVYENGAYVKQERQSTPISYSSATSNPPSNTKKEEAPKFQYLRGKANYTL